MKRSIFGFILFAFTVFLFSSCDKASAAPPYKSIEKAVMPQGVSTEVSFVVSPLPSFGILPSKIVMPDYAMKYPIIVSIGAERQRHGFAGYNYLQCRKV